MQYHADVKNYVLKEYLMEWKKVNYALNENIRCKIICTL